MKTLLSNGPVSAQDASKKGYQFGTRIHRLAANISNEYSMSNLLLIALGMAGAATILTPLDGPYKDEATNLIYQLLFCDRLQLFKEDQKAKAEPPWSTLFSEPPNLEGIAKLAADKHQESRVRALAYDELRAAGKPVAKKEYLGTIIEVRIHGGLDTLAVFADGSTRYINQSGKLIVVDGTPSPFDHEIQTVIQASKPLVAVMGPWEKDRLPAPKEGDIRLTFLVSDGLYFGEGSMESMQREPLAAPLISAGTKLVLRLFEKTINSQNGSLQNTNQPARRETNGTSGAANSR